jgi:threonine dehydratase
LISLRDVVKARERIKDSIHRTPLLSSKTMSGIAGNEVYLKGEHLQKTGSFKIRGAANKLKSIAGQAEHVVAASSGNHGQAVSYMAAQFGLKATIVVPEDAPRCKVEAIKGYGARVLYGGVTSNSRLAKAEELAEEDGVMLIPPYDDPLIMAGQGTTGLEILEQLREVDIVYVPIGGGGLISGISTAIKETNPTVRVIGVEPEAANDTFLSWRNGEIVSIENPDTVADGLRALQPGDLTFPVVQKNVDDLVLVGEDEIKETFAFLLERMKQVVEPSGAVAVAAAMANKARVHGKKVVAVVSGGNVALDRIQSLMPEGEIEDA